MIPASDDSISLATAIVRGLRLRCPRCGEGHLLAGYLRPVEHCSSCQLPIGEIRADDGPPWLTLIVTGHLLAPFLVLIFMSDALPVWASTAIMCLLAVGMCLALLPRAKGLFIAAIWKLGAAPHSEEDSAAD